MEELSTASVLMILLLVSLGNIESNAQGKTLSIY